jgi:hypothetical protein
MTDTAGVNPDQDFARTRDRIGDVDQSQRIGLLAQWSQRLEDQGAH